MENSTHVVAALLYLIVGVAWMFDNGPVRNLSFGLVLICLSITTMDIAYLRYRINKLIEESK